MDDEVQVEPEAEVEASPRELFAEKFAELNESKPTEAEAPVDADAETEADTEVDKEPQPESDKAKVDGPTVAMRMWAKQAGLSEKAINAAKDDESLAAIVEEFTASREAANKPPAKPLEEYAVSLPDEDFPSDDPVRTEFGKVESVIKQLNSDLNLVVSVLMDQKNFVEQTKEQQQQSTIGAFDAKLDAFENPVLGDESSRNQKVRAAIWDTYWELKEESPKAKDDELIQRATALFGITPKQVKRQEALKADSAKRLGGGPSKAVPEPNLTGREAALAAIQGILARNK